MNAVFEMWDVALKKGDWEHLREGEGDISAARFLVSGSYSLGF